MRYTFRWQPYLLGKQFQSPGLGPPRRTDCLRQQWGLPHLCAAP